MGEGVNVPRWYRTERVGYDHYDTRRVEGLNRGVREECLPEEPGLAHAVEVVMRKGEPMRHELRSAQPVFLPSYGYMTARCGSVVKVVLPLDYNERDPDACPACNQAIADNARTPYGRRWFERDTRWDND